jgi:phosphate transport system protein
MDTKHTVRSYDSDLGLLKSKLSEMGKEVEDQIDSIYVDLLSELRTRMSEDSDNINAYTGLIFVAKCCERIGDHITNLAENVHYIEHGKSFIDGRIGFDG